MPSQVFDAVVEPQSQTVEPEPRVVSPDVERLHDVDLLALVVGGNAAHLAEAILLGGGLKGVLRGHGLTKRQRRRLDAAVELGRRALMATEERPRLMTPREVYAFLIPRLAAHPTERFHVICLDARSHVLGDACVAAGGVDSATVDPREVFGRAISWRASAILVAHNHPSGHADPSDHDLALTRQLVNGGKLLGIRVLDHLIIGDAGYVSLQERGLME